MSRTVPLLRWIWPAALAATIFVASGRGQVAAPAIVDFDKAAHFFIYGLLATLVARAGPRPVWAVVITVLYGLTDEWHQSFTPGRSVEWLDVLADALGAVVAVTVYAGWTGYRRWLERPLLRLQPRVENPGQVVPNQRS